MATIPVTIFAERCSPEPINAKPGDTVQWTSTAGHFTVVFGPDNNPPHGSPFPRRVFQGAPGQSDGAIVGSFPGTFKFLVMLHRPGLGLTPIMRDPEIIVG